jgi:hypothetical protein
VRCRYSAPRGPVPFTRRFEIPRARRREELREEEGGLCPVVRYASSVSAGSVSAHACGLVRPHQSPALPLIPSHPAIAVAVRVTSLLACRPAPPLLPEPAASPKPEGGTVRRRRWTPRRCWRCTAATGAICSASSSPLVAAPSTSPVSTSMPSAVTTRSSASPPVRQSAPPLRPPRPRVSCLIGEFNLLGCLTARARVYF